jgi:urease accessory protein
MSGRTSDAGRASFAAPADSVPHETWHAQLTLEFARRDARTVLAARRHDGPLVVQKPLYPEGDAVCHAIIVHPPAGIAGGDELQIDAAVGAGAHALLTTPGAGKWYRSAGAWARQRIAFDVAAGACLEWLPQETIVFDGARADLHFELRLEADAAFIGWDILCLGRTGAGERFTNGTYRARTAVQRDARALWLERAEFAGGAPALASAAVLAHAPVAGTFIAAATSLDRALLPACRECAPASGEGAVTLLPGLMVGRYLGASTEAAKNYFMQLWRALRPAVIGRAAVEPRIWRT